MGIPLNFRTKGIPMPIRKKIRRPRKSRKLTAKKVIFRICIALLTALVCLVVGIYALLRTFAYGPSETVRNMLVLSAMQASATKWVPGLVLPKETVDGIVENSYVVNIDEIDLSDYKPNPSSGSENNDNSASEDEWKDAQDGMLFRTVNGSTYKAYILLVRDPSRVFVGPTYNYETATAGKRIFDAAEMENSVAAINAGEYLDTGGVGNGSQPMGLTYSKGKCVWQSTLWRTFIGFDKNDRLIVAESMTQARADALGIRDGVSFQVGNVLIENDGTTLKLHYVDGNNGTAQRTAIGQREDGTVILLVTDGRTASSLGATHNDVIDIMVSFGAVTAGMLDGGSSSMMYYADYYNKLGIDPSTLDEYQLKGLINKYKAFTTPRRIPTYFMVHSD